MLALAEAETTRKRLEPVAQSAGMTLEDTSTVVAKFSDEQAGPDDKRRAVLDLHKSLLIQLTTSSSKVGRAYGLGRALAETCQRPTGAEPAVFSEVFNPWRIATLTSWLQELDNSFPEHAAAAVTSSLSAWVDWVQKPRFTLLGHRHLWTLRRAWTPLPLIKAAPSATLPLRNQGNIWWSLLAGEYDPVALLTPQGYVQAASNLLRKSGRLVLSFARGWFLALAVTLAAVGGAAWAAIHYLTGPSRTAAVIVTLVGGTGISWRGIGATVGATAKRLEAPLWTSEKEAAIAAAATHLPRSQRVFANPSEQNQDADARTYTSTGAALTDDAHQKVTKKLLDAGFGK